MSVARHGTDSAPLWVPPPGRVAASRMTAFTRWLAGQGRAVDDYAALHAWSVADPGGFWQALVEFCGLRFEQPAERVLSARAMPGARWFEGARLNFAANLLRRDDDHPALIACDEAGGRTVLSHRELRAEVGRAAAALRNLGVRPGDRVAALATNRPETVVLALAAAAVGAVFSSCAPEFGVSAVLQRFGQVTPRLLLAVTGYRYQGREHAVTDRIAALREAVPDLACVVLGDAAAVPGAMSWQSFLERGGGEAPAFEPLPFDHPLYIVYSSGTTGAPKCIVHGAGGTLLQHVKEQQLHCDLGPDDVLFYYTTCGWMMWNWLVSGLASGATLLLWDGAPMAAGPATLFELAAREGVTVFGTSARFLAAAEKAGIGAGELPPAVRTILSTGSPLLPGQFDWVYGDLARGRDLHLASISGGTDIMGCFVLGNPNLPVWRGEIQCAGLGMDVRVLDDAGRELERGRGELACATPFPSMPLGFWNDADGSRYRAAYFERFPGVWAHGDHAERTVHGGFVIHGRSDAVLNPGGVRIGTAEIYREVERVPEVLEALAVGQEADGDVRIVLFVRLRDGLVLDDALARTIRQRLRSGASPRHVPAVIHQVSDLPRTMSGKLAEIAVREVLHGRDPGNREALANPEALAQFAGLDPGTGR